MMRCSKCDMLLISLGFNYYFHPKIKDYYGREQIDQRQCPIAIDPLGNTFKIQPTSVEKIPEEIALELSILSY